MLFSSPHQEMETGAERQPGTRKPDQANEGVVVRLLVKDLGPSISKPMERTDMAIRVEAVYENGMLKLKDPLPLKEHESVLVTIQPALTWADRTAGMLRWCWRRR